VLAPDWGSPPCWDHHANRWAYRCGKRRRGSGCGVHNLSYPIGPKDIAQHDEPESAVARDVTGVGSDLLVDDEDPVRLFSAWALHSRGDKVTEARNGEVSVNILNAESFDLLIANMIMSKVIDAPIITTEREKPPRYWWSVFQTTPTNRCWPKLKRWSTCCFAQTIQSETVGGQGSENFGTSIKYVLTSGYGILNLRTKKELAEKNKQGTLRACLI
jgi:hypothetical protein